MNHNPSPSSPMLARSTSSGDAASHVLGEKELQAQLTDADPEAAVDRIWTLLRDDLYLPARRLAAEALERFPDHERVRRAWSIFERRGRSRVGTGGPEPGRDEEFEWLRHPPDWARGKWVALVGSEVVAAADTLAEVAADLRGKTFSRRPLAHHID